MPKELVFHRNSIPAAGIRSKLYGSVSTNNILTAITNSLKLSESGAKITVEVGDIEFEGVDAKANNRIQHLGEHPILISRKHSEKRIQRKVVVKEGEVAPILEGMAGTAQVEKRPEIDQYNV